MDNFNINDSLRKKIHMLVDRQLSARESEKLEEYAHSNPLVKSEIEKTKELRGFVKENVKRQSVSPELKATIVQIFHPQS